MAAQPSFPALPPQLKTVSHYLKVASEHETRDPVIAYWCRFYAVQKALVIDKSSPEAKTFLFSLLDYLEKRKKELAGDEAITNEVVAEAHIENHADKLFHWADSNDRACVFNKNVVKTFYTAGILFDVLDNFGDVNEEFLKKKKYAKWKAAYIHNCLKNGETPVGGPGANDEFEDDFPGGGGGTETGGAGGSSNFDTNEAAAFGWSPQPQQPQQPQFQPQGMNLPYGNSQPVPAAAPSYVPPPVDNYSQPQNPQALSVEQIAKAQKYCKWAGSALNFDDVPTAVDNLTKALRLLQTGIDE